MKPIGYLCLLLPWVISFCAYGEEHPVAAIVMEDADAKVYRTFDLKQPPVGASYLMVAPQGFLPALLPLARLRQQFGHKVVAVSIEAIHQQFPGEKRQSIFQFLRWAFCHWPAPKLRFVLLAADVATAAPHLSGIPAWPYRDYRRVVVASDYPYTQAGGPGQAFLVGRLPARSCTELSGMVERIVAYEQNRAGKLWQRRISFVIGEGGFGMLADALLENIFTMLISTYLPAAYELTISYANPHSAFFYPADAFPQLVTARLNEGALFFVYVGHGAPDSFGHIYTDGKIYPMFETQHARSVKIQEGFPVVVSLACHTGAYASAYDSLGETLLKQPAGVIAFIGASDVSHPYGNVLLGKAFLSGLFSRKADTLGELLAAAREDVLNASDSDITGFLLTQATQYFSDRPLPVEVLRNDHLYLYNLLGDPATRLLLPQENLPLSWEYRQDAQADIFHVRGVVPDSLRRCTLVVSLEVLPVCLVPDDTKGETGKSPGEVLKARYQRANNKVITSHTHMLQATSWEVTLRSPYPLPPGIYNIKAAVLTPDGLVTGTALVRKGKK